MLNITQPFRRIIVYEKNETTVSDKQSAINLASNYRLSETRAVKSDYSVMWISSVLLTLPARNIAPRPSAAARKINVITIHIVAPWVARYCKKETIAIMAEIKAKTAYSIKITSVFVKKVRNSKTPSAVTKPFVLETTNSLWKHRQILNCSFWNANYSNSISYKKARIYSTFGKFSMIFSLFFLKNIF